MKSIWNCSPLFVSKMKTLFTNCQMSMKETWPLCVFILFILIHPLPHTVLMLDTNRLSLIGICNAFLDYLLCCSNFNSCIFVPVFEAGGWTKSRNVVRHKCSFQYKIVILHYLNHFNWVSHLKIEKRVVRTFSTIDRWHFLNIVLTNKNVKVSHTKETLQKQCKSVPSLSSRSLSYL